MKQPFGPFFYIRYGSNRRGVFQTLATMHISRDRSLFWLFFNEARHS